MDGRIIILLEGSGGWIPYSLVGKCPDEGWIKLNRDEINNKYVGHACINEIGSKIMSYSLHCGK
jgi:hypothetical protein